MGDNGRCAVLGPAKGGQKPCRVTGDTSREQLSECYSGSTRVQRQRDSREQLAGKTAAELQPECSGGGYRTNDTGSHAGLRLGCNSTQPSTKPRRGKEKTGKDGEAKLRNSTPQTVSNARANYFASHTPNAKQHACSTQRGTQDTRACMAGSRAPRRHPTPTAPLPPPPPPHNPTHPHHRTHPPLPHHHLPRIH